MNKAIETKYKPSSKILKGIIFIFIYFLIFISIYTSTRTQAKVIFDENIISARGSILSGQVFFSTNGTFNQSLVESYVIRTRYNQDQRIDIPMYNKYIKYIRLDPLPNTGELLIKDFSIIQGSWFNKKVRKIDLNQIQPKHLYHLEIIEKNSNILHLRATDIDPHILIATDINIITSVIDYYALLQISILSFIILFIFIYIYRGLQFQYFKSYELITAIIILIYSLYTILYGNQHNLATSLLSIYIPILCIYVIYKQGIINYISYIKNMIYVLLLLGFITIMIDFMNDSNLVQRYIQYLKYIIPSMLIAIVFIQKKSFNYLFYKKFLIFLTISIAIFTTLLHYEIITIDRIITYQYRMSMGPWAQKNYTFWYLFLMWGTISFLHLNKVNKKDIFIIMVILILSLVTIMSGYSDSAKLAFIVSVIIYLLFSLFKINIKALMFIPLLLSLYLLLTPWISDLYAHLSYIHPRLGSREELFAVYSSLIKENILFGYGFNSCISLIPTDYLSPEILKSFAHSKYINICSPHTLPLLLWLNFGAFGVAIFSLIIYFSMRKMILITYNYNNQAALLALITSFTVITTFSWGSWYPYSLLTYSFFMGMIFLSMNINRIKD